ncbi:hypothetical protein ACF0H5_021019 [Mactra antiquata]
MRGTLGLVCVWLVSCVITVSGIRCFECADCRIPFRDDDESYKRVCDGASCMRINVTYKHNTILSRGCTHTKVPLERCDRRAVAGTYTETCFCNTDDCNSGNDVIMTCTTISLAAIVLTFYSFITRYFVLQ